MSHPPYRVILRPVLLLLALLPGTALAEVSDKEPTAQLFWAVGLAAGLLCLVFARNRPWLGALVFLPAALWFTSLFLEIHSVDVGPYLLQEQGAAYYVQAYASCAIVFCGLVVGFILHRRRSPSMPIESPR